MIEVVSDCPECRTAIARIGVLDSGRLSVKYREAAMEDRPGHAGGVVLTRPWRTSEVRPTDAGTRTFSFCSCACTKVQCGGRFVLDSVRVRQLAEKALARGHSIRWHPDAAAVQRSEALRPYTEGTYWNERLTERGRPAQRAARLEPSPLTDNSIRRFRTPNSVG